MQPPPIARARWCQSRPLLVALLLLVHWAVCSQASEGDESELFQSCLSSCLATGCTKTPGNSNTCDTICPHPQGHSSYSAPWTLRLMQWDCMADCSYHCMWALEAPKAAAAGQAGEPVYKYFGKWPFVRVFGAQEIASVVFSIANMAAHVHNLHMLLAFVKRHRVQPTAGLSSRPSSGQQQQQQYPYKQLWVVYAAVNINAWLWSSVFHCRDTRVTERLDYFSADLVVAVGCGVLAARVLQLTSQRHLLVLCVLLGAPLLQHMHYMAFVKFDYGYNMTLCIAAGVVTAVAWVVWVTRTRHPGRWALYRFMALIHVAMLLEVLDFPPLLRLFDAHALWHLATVPLTYGWYRFIEADVLAWQQEVVSAAGPGQQGGSSGGISRGGGGGGAGAGSGSVKTQ